MILYIVAIEMSLLYKGVMITSMTLGILVIVFGIFRGKQKGCPIILIALGIVFVLIAVYLGWPR